MRQSWCGNFHFWKRRLKITANPESNAQLESSYYFHLKKDQALRRMSSSTGRRIDFGFSFRFFSLVFLFFKRRPQDSSNPTGQRRKQWRKLPNSFKGLHGLQENPEAEHGASEAKDESTQPILIPRDLFFKWRRLSRPFHQKTRAKKAIWNFQEGNESVGLWVEKLQESSLRWTWISWGAFWAKERDFQFKRNRFAETGHVA